MASSTKWPLKESDTVACRDARQESGKYSGWTSLARSAARHYTGLEKPGPGARSSCLSPYTSRCLSRLWVPAMEHLYQKRLQDGAADPLSFVLVYVSGQATWLEHSYMNGEWAEVARCW